ncbi:hypothetical protein HPB52_013767 [Rhipicephalus sanguineus]|uniref:beta-N-acetylhexosaminidase n=1 Tax=Rhipicephalus sanguineus TaxID=34632 RepID=A0A9D4PPT2_RHISA|nr:hypothetical protein HPB52_013767 [Rhipicephalus sanguineus]
MEQALRSRNSRGGTAWKCAGKGPELQGGRHKFRPLEPGTRCPIVEAAAVRYESIFNRVECLRIPAKAVEAYRQKSAGYISRLVVTLLGTCESFPEPLMDEHSLGTLTSHAHTDAQDAMTMNKMNVLLWKMVGNDSFPLRMTSLLELSSKGAFRVGSHEYRDEDIAHLIEYARVRGVRIVPEVHSMDSMASVGRSHPELLCGNSGFLDPTHKDAVNLVRVLYAELARLFPDQLVHLGGQDFSPSCWSNDSDMQRRIEESRGSVQAYSTLFFDSLFLIPNRLHKAAVVADEIIERWNITVPRIVLVEVPSSRVAGRMGPVTSAGHRALAFCDGLLEHNWTRLYTCDPLGFEGEDSLRNL